ncbi:MAG: family 78 glycoside hydrolase catalytic domain [Bacteroidales bacterium]|nr:family 78 glycoside hydrolase catalytic domain [Bacteroidales bacterium]
MKRSIFRIICEVALFAAVVSSCGDFSTYDMLCENLSSPLAIDSTQPHFSWKILSSAQSFKQSAYEIQVASSEGALLSGDADLWDSGKVRSSDQIMVPYRGKALGQKTIAWWRVRVSGPFGKKSSWSAPQCFGVGILESGPMAGEFIGAAPGEGRSPILRKSFTIESVPPTAVLYVNTLGYHEAYLNGKKVAEDDVLNPAVSQLDKRSLIMAYDVTSLLQEGQNELVLWTGSGWYKKETFNAAYEGPLVKAELDAFSGSDVSVILSTDGTWEGTWSGYSDPGKWNFHGFNGEIMDARIFPASLESKDLSAMEWGPVDVVKVEGIVSSQQMCEPVRIQEALQPVSVEEYNDGWILDFGKVVNAMFEVRLPQMPEGHVSTARFADYVYPNGMVDAVSSNTYISSGKEGGDTFANRFNHHVFRYVILEGLDQTPSASDFTALRMRTDYGKYSSFSSSDEDLNDIYNMVDHTLENLAFAGYMVDCANLERLGYGGDGNASTLSLQLMADVAPLYLNWLQAWNDSIKPDGGLPHTAPNPYTAGGGPYWCSFIVQAPWRSWMSYADPRVLERCYPTMIHWLDYVDAYTKDGLLTPWPDMTYRQWFLGDWAAPFGSVNVSDPKSVGLVNNCSLCQVYEDLVRIATVLGKDSDAEKFLQRLEALRKRIHEEFYNEEDGTYASGSQIDMTYPMLVGVTPTELESKVTEVLKERTANQYKGHLVTGLVGVPVITEWATLNGECDWFYSLLKQRDYPGYLYMIDNGATGTWEHWSGMRSRMHNCFNGIGSWFYQALGGIFPIDEGYRKVLIEPQIPEGLEEVDVSLDTPYGILKVHRNGLHLDVEIPVGVTAMIGGKEYRSGKRSVNLK